MIYYFVIQYDILFVIQLCRNAIYVRVWHSSVYVGWPRRSQTLCRQINPSRKSNQSNNSIIPIYTVDVFPSLASLPCSVSTAVTASLTACGIPLLLLLLLRIIIRTIIVLQLLLIILVTVIVLRMIIVLQLLLLTLVTVIVLGFLFLCFFLFYSFSFFVFFLFFKQN